MVGVARRMKSSPASRAGTHSSSSSSGGRSTTMSPSTPAVLRFVEEGVDAAMVDGVVVAHQDDRRGVVRRRGSARTRSSVTVNVPPALQRAQGRGLDRRAVGHRVGEGHADLDDVRPAPRRARRGSRPRSRGPDRRRSRRSRGRRGPRATERRSRRRCGSSAGPCAWSWMPNRGPMSELCEMAITLDALQRVDRTSRWSAAARRSGRSRPAHPRRRRRRNGRATSRRRGCSSTSAT